VDDPYHLLAHACIQAPSGSPRMHAFRRLRQSAPQAVRACMHSGASGSPRLRQSAHACIQAPSGSPRTCSRIWPDLALSSLTSGWMPSALVTMCWLDRSIDSERLHSAYLMREAIRAHQRLIKA